MICLPKKIYMVYINMHVHLYVHVYIINPHLILACITIKLTQSIERGMAVRSIRADSSSSGVWCGGFMEDEELSNALRMLLLISLLRQSIGIKRNTILNVSLWKFERKSQQHNGIHIWSWYCSIRLGVKYFSICI